MAIDQDEFDNLSHIPRSLTVQSCTWCWICCSLLITILIFGIARACNIVGHLRIFLTYLCSISTSAGRQLRKRQRHLSSSLAEMRIRLKQINMVQNFVAYSKLERKIKAAARQLAELSTDSLDKRIIKSMGISITVYIFQGCLIAYLFSLCPNELLRQSDLEVVQLNYPHCIYVLIKSVRDFVPTKLLLIGWVGLCHLFTKPVVEFIGRSVCKSCDGNDDALQNDDETVSPSADVD